METKFPDSSAVERNEAELRTKIGAVAHAQEAVRNMLIDEIMNDFAAARMPGTGEQAVHIHTFNFRAKWEQESDAADGILRLLGFDPERSRDENGDIRMDLVRDSVRTRAEEAQPLELDARRYRFWRDCWGREQFLPTLSRAVASLSAPLKKGDYNNFDIVSDTAISITA